jgi:TonB family protein
MIMDRLQKKCFIVTASLHGLLVLVLLFGSALMPARNEENNVKLFTAYDPKLVTDALSSGGDPNVKVPVTPPQENPSPKPVEPTPPPPKPEPPVAKPPPKPEARVEPPKAHPVRNDIPDVTPEKPKNSRLTPDELTPVSPKLTRKSTLDKDSLKPTKRKPDDKAKAAQDAADAKERARRKREAREFVSAIRTIGENLSTSTLVQMTPGPGGGGEVSANYRDIIASKYYNAWVAPVSLDDDTPVVVATVTIARSGEVVSARIVKRSGNSLMDRSIQNALETVTFIEPFPEGSHEQERTVTIQFNLQAKRQIG